MQEAASDPERGDGRGRRVPASPRRRTRRDCSRPRATTRRRVVADARAASATDAAAHARRHRTGARAQGPRDPRRRHRGEPPDHRARDRRGERQARRSRGCRGCGIRRGSIGAGIRTTGVRPVADPRRLRPDDARRRPGRPRARPRSSETVRWHAESTTVTSTATAEAPEPKPTNGVLANGTKTNGTSSNGVHEPAKTASKPEAPVETPKAKRRWRHLRPRQVALSRRTSPVAARGSPSPLRVGWRSRSSPR